MSHRRLTDQQSRVLRMMAKARLGRGEAETSLVAQLVLWLRTNDPRWSVPAARARVREVVLALSEPS